MLRVFIYIIAWKFMVCNGMVVMQPLHTITNLTENPSVFMRYCYMGRMGGILVSSEKFWNKERVRDTQYTRHQSREVIFLSRWRGKHQWKNLYQWKNINFGSGEPLTNKFTEEPGVTSDYLRIIKEETVKKEEIECCLKLKEKHVRTSHLYKN